MAADTTLNITQIELGLARYFNFRKNIIVPNVSWGMLNHEADMLVLNKSGYVTEVEIKRSWADFLADFRKDHKRDDSLVSWRYYAVPISIIDKCREKLAEVDPLKRWGLLEYDDYDGYCYVHLVYHPSNINEHFRCRKINLEEQFKLARLGAIRTWSLKAKLVGMNATPLKNDALDPD